MAETFRAAQKGALRVALAAFAISAFVGFSGSCKKDKPSASRIAVIPKGTTHEFWKAVHAGSVKAARELGVDVVWKGPLREDDLKAQIDVVQSFTAQGVSGIVVAPLSDKGLVSAVGQAVRAKIPVVIFDSDLQGKDYTSFVATDNFQAGKLAADELAKLMGEKGNVVVLRYNEGSASTANRENGFLDGIKKHANIKVKSDNQYGGATTETAHQASENLLSAMQAGQGGVDGIFCPNESTTFGMLLALEQTGLVGKVKFVGFDASPKLVEAVRQGHLDGLVLQNPFQMGYLAVATMSRHLRGEAVEPRIDTGATFVGKHNLDRPEIGDLIAPDLSPWLEK
ncbi:MAG: substrate-binding domain-containing protein [Polyangiaceae bacterium]